MAETFRDIIDEFDDRSVLVERWKRKSPKTGKVTGSAVNMWYHRDSVPGWAWASFEAAASELGNSKVTMKRLSAADLEAPRQRAAQRQERAAS